MNTNKVTTGDTWSGRWTGGWLRELFQVWRQEDAGKCSENDKDRMVQMKTIHLLCYFSDGW